ncbi:unnamed protein product [Symbiodinium sp. CCMP2592]|nr:unnamed protein product [Symbiodinium sp. CCMP2592]
MWSSSSHHWTNSSGYQGNDDWNRTKQDWSSSKWWNSRSETPKSPVVAAPEPTIPSNFKSDSKFFNSTAISSGNHQFHRVIQSTDWSSKAQLAGRPVEDFRVHELCLRGFSEFSLRMLSEGCFQSIVWTRNSAESVLVTQLLESIRESKVDVDAVALQCIKESNLSPPDKHKQAAAFMQPLIEVLMKEIKSRIPKSESASSADAEELIRAKTKLAQAGLALTPRLPVDMKRGKKRKAENEEELAHQIKNFLSGRPVTSLKDNRPKSVKDEHVEEWMQSFKKQYKGKFRELNKHVNCVVKLLTEQSDKKEVVEAAINFGLDRKFATRLNITSLSKCIAMAKYQAFQWANVNPVLMPQWKQSKSLGREGFWHGWRHGAFTASEVTATSAKRGVRFKATWDTVIMIGLSHGNANDWYWDIDYSMYVHTHWRRLWGRRGPRGWWGNRFLGSRRWSGGDRDIFEVRLNSDRSRVEYVVNRRVLWTAPETAWFPMNIDASVWRGALYDVSWVCDGGCSEEPGYDKVFLATDAKRWGRGPGGPSGSDRPNGEGYTSGEYAVFMQQSLDGCRMLCNERYWCAGFGFKHTDSFGDYPDWQEGSCQLMSRLVETTSRVKNFDSYRKVGTWRSYGPNSACRIGDKDFSEDGVKTVQRLKNVATLEDCKAAGKNDSGAGSVTNQSSSTIMFDIAVTGTNWEDRGATHGL